MDLTASLSQLAAFLGLGLALAVPAARRWAIALLSLATALAIANALLGPDPRTLETVHNYAGYEGASLEVTMRGFPTGSFTAPAWQWPLPWIGFAALWIVVLRRLGTRLPAGPLLLPMLFAWSATATWLGMQALAAPAAVLQPAGLDRFLWPAGLAVTLLAARSASGILQLVVIISATVIAARLPAALFSKLASDLHLGTSLDISSVIDIVNPMTQMQFEPQLVSGSGAQQFWLIWLEQLIIYPALHSLSLFGIGLGAYLWHKHAPRP